MASIELISDPSKFWRDFQYLGCNKKFYTIQANNGKIRFRPGRYDPLLVSYNSTKKLLMSNVHPPLLYLLETG